MRESPHLTAPLGGVNDESWQRAEFYRRQLETVAANATLALFIMDERQQCTYMNPAAERLTGFRLEELKGKPLHDYIHHTRPDGRPYPLSECPIDQAFPTGMREQGEEVFVHRDGHFYPVAFTASPIREGGRTVGTIIEVRDITEEKRREAERERIQEERDRLFRELEEEKSRLSSIFQYSPSLIAVLEGPEHRFRMTNPYYNELLDRNDLVGKTIREAMPELEGQGFIELLDEVYRTGKPYVGNEVPARLRKGPERVEEEHFFNFVYQPLRNSEGEVTGILGHGVDVTDLVRARKVAEVQAEEMEAQSEELQQQARILEETQSELEEANSDLGAANSQLARRAEEALRAQATAEEDRALVDSFFQAAPVAVGYLDRELRYQRVNEALAALDGKPPEAMLGRRLAEVIPDYASQLEPLYRRVMETGEPIRNLEISGPRPSAPDTIGHYLLNYFPVKVRGEIVGVGVVALDVSEQKAAEEARREEARIVETLHRIGHSLASELELEKIVQDVTDAATELTGAQFGAFFYNVLSEKGESLTLYTISGVPREKFSHYPNPRATQIFQPTFHGTEIVRSDDITQDPRYGHNAPYHGMPKGHLPVKSYLAVPVISRTGEVLGGLFFGHPEAGRFELRHERLAMGIAGWAAVAMDNARLYKTEHQARAEAERANRVKSEFLATMSHELRTPLNAMLGYADLLLSGIPEPLPEGHRQKVERIDISARHLLSLIEEILSFSRLEAGEERLELETVDPSAIVQEVEALMEPLALAKHVSFRCHTPSEPQEVETDPRKIRQILINLVGNAIKFTEEGEVQLSFLHVGDELVFRVMDTGPGIPEDYMEKIFDPFWQVEGGSTRKAGGTGLGLSVTRRLARLMGGDVTVESRPGEGSVFTVRLPAKPPEPLGQDILAPD